MSDTQSTAGAGGGDLWCMHIEGPDDLHAAPDFWTALAWAAELNTFIAEKAIEGGWATDDNYPLSQATVRRWTGTPESHAVHLSMELADRAEHTAKRETALASAPPAGQGNEAITECLAEQEAAARGRANDQRPASSSEHWHRAQAAAYEAAHAYAIARPLASAAPASSTEEAKGFTCAARRQGSAAGNDPADCNWPVCGCDPHADKVIAALQESGLLASAPPAPTPEAGALDGHTASAIAEATRESGWWASCTGCHETAEGHETGAYPYSDLFACHVGSGCSECGGLGVVWHRFTEDDAASWEAAMASDAPAPSRPADRAIEELCDKLDRWSTVDNPQECADLMDEARLVILALRDAPRNGGDGWKGISSAPTDGTRVQGYGPHEKDGYYIDTIHCWEGRWTIEYMHGFGAPTHWRPLPAPPSPNAGDGTQPSGVQGGGR